MAYPERGASYRNKPAWLDRATKDEGPTGDGEVVSQSGSRFEPLINEKGNAGATDWEHLVEPSSPIAAQDARESAAKRVRNSRAMPDRFPPGGLPYRRADGGKVRGAFDYDLNTRPIVAGAAVAKRGLDKATGRSLEAGVDPLSGQSVEPVRGAAARARADGGRVARILGEAAPWSDKGKNALDYAKVVEETATPERRQASTRRADRQPEGRADGGRVREPLVDRRGRTLEQLAADDPSGPPLSLKMPSSASAAQDARERAAERVRNSRAMPDSFPVGTRNPSPGGGYAGRNENRDVMQREADEGTRQLNSSKQKLDAEIDAAARQSRRKGGAVPRRAEGGGAGEAPNFEGGIEKPPTKYPNKIKGLTDEEIDANEARRPKNYDPTQQIAHDGAPIAKPKLAPITRSINPFAQVGKSIGEAIGRGPLGFKRGGAKRATGGGVDGGKGPFPGQTMQQFTAEEDRAKRARVFDKPVRNVPTDDSRHELNVRKGD